MFYRFGFCLLFVCVATCAPLDSSADQFTPVVVSPLTSNVRPFTGTDGQVHIVYELVLTNANATPATLKKVEILDAANPSKKLGDYEGQRLQTLLRATNGAPAEDTAIAFNQTRLLLIEVVLDSASSIPSRLAHRIEVLGGATPAREAQTPVLLDYTGAYLEIARKLPQIAAPLTGNGWVALNGCCGLDVAHRPSSLTVNGGTYFAQRFAIDWMRLDKNGRLVHGDASEARNYTSYDADVLAVADGTVVATLDSLSDQKPGSLPDPKTITLENVDGNHIVLDLGDGVFAFYAHLQKGSVKVRPGDHVRRGQLLAKLGNTGNSSAPHLHFHLMEGPSVLGSNGVPYCFDSFALAGRIPEAEFAKATGVEGNWSNNLLSTPSPRRQQYPLDLDIIDFPAAK